jgi:predicted amidohydrolase YtcJ
LPPPLLLVGGTVHTVPGEPPVAAAVLVENGRIVFVGDAAEARKRSPQAKAIELPGAVIYPGFVDAHGHLLGLGQLRDNLELRGKSKEDILDLVKARVARAAPGEIVMGRGWDQNLWKEKSFPTATELSAVSPKNPVVLRRIDGHALWVNQAMLAKAGLLGPDVPADPDGGRILRDTAGKPAGVFVDNAMALVFKALPSADSAKEKRLFGLAFEACARAGLTGVGDASGDGRETIAALRELARERKIPIRVYATLGPLDPSFDELLEKGPFEEGVLTVRAVKLYADGALGSRGAALLADYSDEPRNRGLVRTSPEKLEAIVAKCLRKGWQVWIHAIGDRANRFVLDAYEKALDVVRPADPRPRIEHAQVLAPEDLPRFAKLGVIASIQPTHATSDMPWAETRVGPGRIAGAYAWRQLVRSGARLAGGSDFPVESENPLLGFYAAVTRQDVDGRPPGGWGGEEKLTRAEALRLFTSDNAYASFTESRRGKVTPGFDADLTILDRDIASGSLPAAEIPKARVLMTVVGGEIVYRAR